MRMSLEWWRGGVDFSSQKTPKLLWGDQCKLKSFLSKKSTDPDPASYRILFDRTDAGRVQLELFNLEVYKDLG